MLGLMKTPKMAMLITMSKTEGLHVNGRMLLGKEKPKLNIPQESCMVDSKFMENYYLPCLTQRSFT